MMLVYSFFFNLLVSQFCGVYASIAADIQGHARLARGEIIIETFKAPHVDYLKQWFYLEDAYSSMISIILHYITLHYITLHYIILYYIILYYIILYYIILLYIILYYIIVHYMTLHCTLHFILYMI